VDEGLDHIDKNARAALINMAKNLPLARIILTETQYTKWRTIWEEEMAERFSRASIPEPETRPEPGNDPTPPTTEILSDTDVRQDDQPASDDAEASRIR
jgi:hypothetical protein